MRRILGVFEVFLGVFENTKAKKDRVMPPALKNANFIFTESLIVITVFAGLESLVARAIRNAIRANRFARIYVAARWSFSKILNCGNSLDVG